MPRNPAYVPRGWLENKDDFSTNPDALWKQATTFEEAIELARSREQHELGLAINKLREQGKNSIHDVAEELGENEDTFWRKLTGRVPAQEEDLIVWSWLTGEKRRTYSPKDLAGGGPLWLPMWPIPRFRVKRRS